MFYDKSGQPYLGLGYAAHKDRDGSVRVEASHIPHVFTMVLIFLFTAAMIGAHFLFKHLVLSDQSESTSRGLLLVINGFLWIGVGTFALTFPGLFIRQSLLKRKAALVDFDAMARRIRIGREGPTIPIDAISTCCFYWKIYKGNVNTYISLAQIRFYIDDSAGLNEIDGHAHKDNEGRTYIIAGTWKGIRGHPYNVFRKAARLMNISFESRRWTAPHK